MTINGYILINLDLTSSGQSTSLNTIAQFADKDIQSLQGRAAHLPESFRIIWDYVGYLGCIQESTMNPLIRKKLLSKNRNVVIR